MAQYRKKPVIIEAVHWSGHNLDDVLALVAPTLDPTDVLQRVEMGESSVLMIHTLEGVMAAQVGDAIIKGVKGELYPCKPDIFEATYEAV